MKSRNVTTLRTEELAKRVEQELRDAGRNVKREGRTVTEYLLPKRKQKKSQAAHKHTSKRERDYGYARGVEE